MNPNTPHMALNGKDITEFGITPLDGTLNTLMKPAPTKKLATNENKSSHGIIVLSSPNARRYDKQDISLMFHIEAPSLIDLNRMVENLVEELKQGKDGTGVNELAVPELEKCYRLVYVNADKYNNFGLSGEATLSIKFTETNPNNRTLQTI